MDVMKMMKEQYDGDELIGYLVRCPGCEGFGHHMVGFHHMRIKLHPDHDAWQYDGNPDTPTFSPSLLSSSRWWIEEEQRWIDYRCHFYLEGGTIRYLSDSTHELAGQKVPLPPW